MGHVQSRGKGRWAARWIDPTTGRERLKSFPRKADAEAHVHLMEADIRRGVYIDPDAGRITLRAYAKDWLARQTTNPSTREATTIRVNTHILPTLGDRSLSSIRPGVVQSWLRGMEDTLAPRTRRVVLANLSAMLAAAVDDERIPKNPCAASSVRRPKVDAEPVVPWPKERIDAVHDELGERYRVAVTLAAGLGLRQGEVFGLAVNDVDFLRRMVRVTRQVKIVGARQVFAPPKGGKVREVPLPEPVAVELAAHLARFPATTVTLPWQAPDGPQRAAQLVLSTREHKALNRIYFNAHVWKPAVVKAGITDPGRRDGMHQLRHWYASALLEGGVSIKALSTYLGHSDPGFTLRTYTHLMPSSEDKARNVVARALTGKAGDAGDGQMTDTAGS